MHQRSQTCTLHMERHSLKRDCAEFCARKGTTGGGRRGGSPRCVIKRLEWLVLRVAFLIRHGASGSDAGAAGPILSFSGDMEDDGEDQPIDLFVQASAERDGEDDSGGEGEREADDGEPEYDFNAAWEVLDLARAIYEKQKEDDLFSIQCTPSLPLIMFPLFSTLFRHPLF